MTKLSEVLPKHVQDQCGFLLDLTENKPITEENKKTVAFLSASIASTIAHLLNEESKK